jgi:hypothetical protein
MDGVTNGRRRNMRVKWVFRCDTIQGIFRIARVMWEHGEPGKPGGGYSAKFAVALDPRLVAIGGSLCSVSACTIADPTAACSCEQYKVKEPLGEPAHSAALFRSGESGSLVTLN